MMIGVVIVNYNQNQKTWDCLDSLAKVDTQGFELEVFVADNNSNPPLDTKNKETNNLKIKFIQNEENLGFAQGSNVGIKQALSNGSDYVLILNNDTTVDKSFLTNLIKAFEDPSVGIVSPKIYFSKGREFHKNRYEKKDLGKVIWYSGGILDMKNVLASHRGVDEVDRGQFEERAETDFATGCCMLVKREVFESIGLLNPKYFLYLEDLDFSIRAKKAGFAIKYVPDSIVWHYNAGSTGGSGSNLQDYFITRNRMIFGMKYASLKSKLALLKESFKIIIIGRKWQKIGIKDYYLRNLGRGSFPV